MTSTHRPAPLSTSARTDHRSDPVARPARTPWWLLLTLPAAVVGMVAAAVGAFVDGAYQGMTDNWADQTWAQDIADLAVGFPALILFGLLARRGSARGLIAWLGTLIALFYTYVIYGFQIPYGHMYLVNVVLLGAFGWAFAGALRSIDAEAIRRRFDEAAPVRSTAYPLAGIATAFLALWMVEDIPATIRGVAPETVQEVGLLVNPIHVLDTAFLLPACIVAAIALLRGHAFGYVFVPALLTTLGVISVGIVTIMLVAIAAGEGAVVPVAIGMAITGIAQFVLAARFLRHLGRERA